MSQTKTVVSIGGKQYTVSGDESAEYIHRVALKANSKYEELRAWHPSMTGIDLAMLTAINIADDYIKLYDELQEARKELETVRAELEQERARKVQPIKTQPAAGKTAGGGKVSALKK